MKTTLSPTPSFRQSLVISLVLHLLLFLLLSLLLTRSPFKKEIEPIIVTIDAPSAMAEGAQATPAPPPPQERATPQPQTKPHTATPSKARAEQIIQQAKTKTRKTSTTSTPVKSSTPTPTEEASPSQESAETADDILARSIEQALQSTGRKSTGTAATSASGQQGTGSDPLGDATWKSRPRKTIFFPDIAAKIREKIPNPLMGYSVTARIVFDSQGLAVRVDIVRSSGDPMIDSIFLTELKKIRVEAIADERLDEITKTFKISVR